MYKLHWQILEACTDKGMQQKASPDSIHKTFLLFLTQF